MQSNGLLLRNGDDVCEAHPRRLSAHLKWTASWCAATSVRVQRQAGIPQRTLDPWSALSVSHHERGRAARHANRNRPVAAGESAFNPTAVSGAKAAGLWQFMPATGRHYGLEQTFWYDGCRDVLGATNAALDYLENPTPCLATGIWRWRPATGAKAMSAARWSAIAPRGLPETFEAIRMPNRNPQLRAQAVGRAHIFWPNPSALASNWTNSTIARISWR